MVIYLGQYLSNLLLYSVAHDSLDRLPSHLKMQLLRSRTMLMKKKLLNNSAASLVVFLQNTDYGNLYFSLPEGYRDGIAACEIQLLQLL